MKIYKYRDLSKRREENFVRLGTLLHTRAFWCSRPDTLNDRAELKWTCDFSITDDTSDLLAEFLFRFGNLGRSRVDAQMLATLEVASGRVKASAEPILSAMIDRTRNEIGLVSFGNAPDNEILWERYGGRGAGVCIELDVPDNLLCVQLFPVQYRDSKKLSIGELLRIVLGNNNREIFSLSLLTKYSSWAPEAEIRFVSKMQAVTVAIEGSRITRLILGDRLSPSLRKRIEDLATALSITCQDRANQPMVADKAF